MIARTSAEVATRLIGIVRRSEDGIDFRELVDRAGYDYTFTYGILLDAIAAGLFGIDNTRKVFFISEDNYE